MTNFKQIITTLVLAGGFTSLALENTAQAGNPQVVNRRIQFNRVPVRTGFVKPTVAYFGHAPVYGNFGRGDVIRATGEAARNFSRARINNEVARDLKLDNDVKQVETRLERRAIGKSARAAYYADKRARRQAYLEQSRAEAAARAELERLQIEARIADLESSRK